MECFPGGRDRSVMDVMDFIADPKKDEVEARLVRSGGWSCCTPGVTQDGFEEKFSPKGWQGISILWL